MQRVYVKFPKTGLGNMLLVWAKAVVFAHINQLPCATSSWWGLRWGALLRREKKKRLYIGYFRETSFFNQLKHGFWMARRSVEFDPPILPLTAANKAELFVFREVITDEDLFGSLRNHSASIKTLLYDMLMPRMKQRLDLYEPPMLGLHVRRGDFKIGNQTTPIEFFVEVVLFVRSTLQSDLPVTIFSDADAKELTPLLALPNVILTEDKPDILDILLLSKSKIMVLSKSSTFSYWAAFLSDALVIRPADDWQEKIKDNSSVYSEWKWNGSNASLDAGLAAAVRRIFQ